MLHMTYTEKTYMNLTVTLFVLINFSFQFLRLQKSNAYSLRILILNLEIMIKTRHAAKNTTGFVPYVSLGML